MTDQLDNYPSNGEMPDTQDNGASAGGRQAKPQQVMSIMLTSFRSFASEGKKPVYTMTGREVGGTKDRDSKAVAFDPLGKQIEVHLNSKGVRDLANIDPAIEISLAGNWNKRTYQKNGKEGFNWEFKVASFSFDGPAKTTNGLDPAPKSAPKAKSERSPAKKREESGEKVNPKDRPLKDLDLTVSRAEFRTTASGTACLNLFGKNDKGQRSHAVVWGDDAQRLSDTFGAVELSEENTVSISLKGYWKPNEWTNDEGKTKKSFEFVVKEYGQPRGLEAQPAPQPDQMTASQLGLNPGAARNFDDEIPF